MVNQFFVLENRNNLTYFHQKVATAKASSQFNSVHILTALENLSFRPSVSFIVEVLQMREAASR